MKFKITGQLITDILEENGYRVNFIEHRSASDLHGICFFNDVSEACASWNLYLPLEDRRFPLHQLSGELTFVTTMRYDPLEVPANISLIAVENTSSLHNIYNKIFDIFVFFRQWELELKLAVAKRDLQHIAKLGMDALHNPLFVHDINYNYVLWTKRVEGQTVPTVNFRTGVVTTPIDMLPILTNSAAYKETLGKRGAHTEEKLCGLIAGHFKDLAVHIGISNEFSQFWDLSYAASQAEYAVKVNAVAAFQKLLLLPFSKHAVSIILAYGKNCLPLPFILSPAIEKLKTYDRENQSDFLYTLQVLLACERNVTEAAAMLFIHRTTMSYRISRIESIAGIDLDDCNERLYLQICFSLLDSTADTPHE